MAEILQELRVDLEQGDAVAAADAGEEVVPADMTEERAGSAEMASQQGGEQGNGAIAVRKPVSVVERLEVVEVEIAEVAALIAVERRDRHMVGDRQIAGQLGQRVLVLRLLDLLDVDDATCA